MKNKPKKEKKPGLFKQLRLEIKENKSAFAVYMVLRVLVIAAGVRSLFTRNFEGTFLCALTLLLLLIPTLVEHVFKVRLPTTLEIVVFIFIFAAEILGELNDYYVKFTLWDTMLHITTGFLAAAVGLSLIDILNRSERFGLKLSPLFVALVSFCFSMTIGVLWEFFEFGADLLLATDMQKDTVVTSISSVLLNPEPVNKAVQIADITDTAVNGQPLGIDGYLDIGLIDTMKDLFVNFIGAVTFSVFGFFYTKYSGRMGKRLVEGLKITKDVEADGGSAAVKPDGTSTPAESSVSDASSEKLPDGE